MQVYLRVIFNTASVVLIVWRLVVECTGLDLNLCKEYLDLSVVSWWPAALLHSQPRCSLYLYMVRDSSKDGFLWNVQGHGMSVGIHWMRA